MADDDDATAAATVAAMKAPQDRRLAAEAHSRAKKACRAEEERLRAVALDEYKAAHKAIWA